MGGYQEEGPHNTEDVKRDGEPTTDRNPRWGRKGGIKKEVWNLQLWDARRVISRKAPTVGIRAVGRSDEQLTGASFPGLIIPTYQLQPNEGGTTDGTSSLPARISIDAQDSPRTVPHLR